MGKSTAAKHRQPARRAKAAAEGIGPTPEQMARFTYTPHSPTTSTGLVMGRAYLRDPWFESLVRRDWTDAQREARAPAFTAEDLHALRGYRNAHETAQRSEVRSCLNIERGGARGEHGVPSPALLRARRTLAAIEAAIGPLIETMRAIAIDDMSYAQVAMARFGAREQEWYDDATGTILRKPAPRSGRHSVRIREEFLAGTRRLTAWVSGVRAPTTAEPSGGDAPRADPAATARSDRPISDAIDAAIENGSAAVAIAAAPWTAQAIARENGALFDPENDLTELSYAGLPVNVRPDWVFGWVLVDSGGYAEFSGFCA